VYFRAGQLVYAMGEPGDQLYLVVEGKVKIGSRGDDGRESLLEIVGPSEMFGALSV
jgi:CRP/FNR family transcriptional regulator, cyclic AMP receptor protein